MTTKEWLEGIGNLTETKGEDYEEKRQELLGNIAKQNTARATKRAEKNAEENAPIAEGIKTYLVGTMTATEIKNALVANGITVSIPKVTAVAKLLVADGVVKVEKKVGDTKNYYTLA